MEHSKEELISKLESVAAAQAKVSAIQEKIKKYRQKDNYERKIQLPDLFIGESNVGRSESFVNSVTHQ